MCDFECRDRGSDRRLSGLLRRRLHSALGFLVHAREACPAWILLIGRVLQAAASAKPENHERRHRSSPSDNRGLVALARIATLAETAEGIRRPTVVQIA